MKSRGAAGLLIAVIAFAVYVSNAQWNGSYDSAPTSLLAFSTLERGRLDLDEFRNSYFTGLGGQYAFVEAPNGHLAPLFPVGTAILAAPVYGVFFGLDRLRGSTPDITSPAFEAERRFDERIAAALLAALSVGLFFLCAARIGTPVQAAIATIVYAFASSVWTIGSQALWQHGPVNLCLLASLYALLRAAGPRAAVWTAIAGAAAGFLPVIRPTALVFTVALALFVFVYSRTRFGAFCTAAAAGLLPGIAWNAFFFHSLLGGYTLNAGHYSADPVAAALGFAGLLVSPSRGLFIFTPVFLFSIAGAVLAYRSSDHRARLIVFLCMACSLLILNYAFFSTWWGGYTYGPRFLTDCAAVASLALVYALDRVRTAIGIAALWSIAVQAAGAYSGAAGADWNAIPLSVDTHPRRLWQLTDSQIERNARAFYYKTFAWDAASNAIYVRAARASVTSVTPAGQYTTAVVHNTGTVPLYGYTSGVFVGQLRLRGRNRTLYLRGIVPPGQSGTAIGDGPVLDDASAIHPIFLNVNIQRH